MSYAFFGYGADRENNVMAAFNAANEILRLTVAQVQNGLGDQWLMPVCFIHGLKIYGGNQAQRTALFELLMTHLADKSESADNVETDAVA